MDLLWFEPGGVVYLCCIWSKHVYTYLMQRHRLLSFKLWPSVSGAMLFNPNSHSCFYFVPFSIFLLVIKCVPMMYIYSRGTHISISSLMACFPFFSSWFSIIGSFHAPQISRSDYLYQYSYPGICYL